MNNLKGGNVIKAGTILKHYIANNLIMLLTDTIITDEYFDSARNHQYRNIEISFSNSIGLKSILLIPRSPTEKIVFQTDVFDIFAQP
jgi:hypothetical protein